MIKLIYDAHNAYWSNEKTYNIMFLRSEEAYFNDILGKHIFVPVYDVIKALGFNADYTDKLDIKLAWDNKMIGWNYPEKIKFDLDHRDDGSIEITINAWQPSTDENSVPISKTLMIETVKAIHTYCKHHDKCTSCPFSYKGVTPYGNTVDACVFDATNPVEWRINEWTGQ